MSTDSKPTASALDFNKVLTERVQPALNYDDKDAVIAAVQQSQCDCYGAAFSRLRESAARAGAPNIKEFLKYYVRTAEEAKNVRLICVYNGVCKLHSAALWLQIPQSVRDAFEAAITRETQQ